MKAIKILAIIFMFLGMLLPLSVAAGDTSQDQAKKSVQEHTETADDDEREKKDNDQQVQAGSNEEHTVAKPPEVIAGSY